MVWLTSQSVWTLVFGCVGIASLAAVGSRLGVRALVPQTERESSHAIAGPLMPALGAAFAILVALTLSSEADYHSSARTIVSDEAANASQLAWAATSPEVQGAAIRAALSRYLVATRSHEWHGSSASSGADPATATAVASLQRTVRAQAKRPTLGTPLSSELLAALDGLIADRRARLAAASRELPGLYAITLALSALALIVNACALTIRSRTRAALLISGLVAVIGVSIALVFALGTPFRGPIVVSGQPIDAVVHDIANGYFRS